jgi:hypothetical protein
VVGDYGLIYVSADGGEWLQVGEGVTVDDLYAIEWTGNDYVAIGEGGTVLTSLDGQTWLAQSVGANGMGMDIAAGDGGTVLLFSGSAGSVHLYQRRGLADFEGVAWQDLNFDSWPHHVVWNGEAFLFAGPVGNFHRSADLASWSVTPYTLRSSLRGAATHNGKTVAVGDDGKVQVYHRDGLWIDIPATGATGDLRDVQHLNGSWIAVGKEVLRSADGVNWTVTTPFGGGTVEAIDWSAAYGYVAVGKENAAAIWRSADGTNWYQVAVKSGLLDHNDYHDYRDVLVTDSQVLALRHNQIIWSETLGTDEWGVATLSNYPQKIAWDGSAGYLAGGFDGELWKSTDGRVWQSVGSPVTATIFGVAYTDGRFVIAAQDGSIWSSADRETWTEEDSRNNYQLFDLESGNGAVATGSGAVLVREASGNWRHLSRNRSQRYDIYELHESNGIIVGGGRYGYMFSRLQGGNWSLHRNPYVNNSIGGLASNADATVWIAAGDAGRIFRWEGEGTLWREVAAYVDPLETYRNALFHGVAWRDGRFVAVGRNGIARWSDDGLNWSSGTVPDNASLSGAMAWSGGFAAGGFDRYCYVSADGVVWTKGGYVQSMSGLASDGQALYAVATNDVWKSDDGTHWHLWAENVLPKTTTPTAFNFHGGAFYISWGYDIGRSVDGKAWDFSDSDGVYTRAIIGTETAIWAAGDEGSLLQADIVRIVTHPESQQLDGAAAIDLMVEAVGTPPLGYQWYEGAPGDRGAPVAGATKSTLHLDTVEVTTSYWVEVTGGRAAEVSAEAEIEVVPPPVFITQPQSATAVTGNTLLLSVEMDTELDVRYQWYEGVSGERGSPVGTDAPSLDTGPLTASTAYWVEVFYGDRSVLSTTAFIELIFPPVIIAQPTPATVMEGNSIELSASATGSLPMTFQWYRGSSGDTGDPVTGAMEGSLTTGALWENTSYWVRISNTAGVVDSAAALVTVVAVPRIVAGPDGATVAQGQAVALEVEATGTGQLSYQWYQGASGDVAEPVSGAIGPVFQTPAMTATTQYWVRVTNAYGSADSAAAEIVVLAIPQIITQPTDKTIARGSSTTLNASASGTEPLNWQWYHGDSGDLSQPVSGASGATLTTPVLSEAARYWARASNAVGFANTRSALVSVLDPPEITRQPQAATIHHGGITALDVQATGSKTLTYAWYAGNAGNTEHLLQSSSASHCEVYPLVDTNYWVRISNPVGSVDSVAVKVTVLQPPTVILSADRTMVLEGESVVFAAATTGTEPLRFEWFLGESGDDSRRIAGVEGADYTSFGIPAETTIWVRVTNEVGSIDSAALTIALNQPPEIVDTSSSAIVESGKSMELKVLARGTGPLAYQWYAGQSGDTSAPLSGASAATLLLEGIDEMGAWWCLVTNAYGTAATPTIRLLPYHMYDDWGWETPAPSGSPLRDVIFFKNQWFTVGVYGSIMASFDGAEWVSVFSGTEETLHGLAASAELLMAVGDSGTVLISEDGILWEPCPTGYLYDNLAAHWDGERFVLGTGGNRVLWSEDGRQWSAANLLGLTSSWEVEGIASNGCGISVMVGARPENWSNKGFIFRYTQATGWTAVEIETVPKLYDVIWDGDRFIACGHYGAIYLSSDGLTWTEVETPDGFNYYSIVSDGTQTIALGKVGHTIRSVDGGATWMAGSTGNSQDVVGSCHADGQFTVVCDRDPFHTLGLQGAILTSVDGVSWSQWQTGFVDDIHGICQTTHGFHAVAEAGRIYHSTDGTTWSVVYEAAATHWYGITAHGSQLIAYGFAGKIAVSEDGESWNVMTPWTQTGTDACRHGDYTYIVGGEDDLVRSLDGYTWEVVDPAIQLGGNGIASDGSSLVVVGNFGALFRSVDGLEWEAVSHSSTSTFLDVTYGNGRFIAVGRLSHSTTESILRSDDGILWQEVPHGVFGGRGIGFINTVIWDGWRYVAVCDQGYIGTSTDGTQWRVRRAPTNRILEDVISDGTTLYAVGRSGTVISSKSLFISRQPADVEVDEGEAALLEVVSIPSDGVTCQWYAGERGNTSRPVVGAASKQWLTGPMHGDASYWARITDGVQTVDTRTVNVSVAPVFRYPQILLQPQDATDGIGGQHLFSTVIDSYTLPMLQWEVDAGAGWEALPAGTGVTGVTTPQLELSNVQQEQDGNRFRVKLALSMDGRTIEIASRPALLAVRSSTTQLESWLADHGVHVPDPLAVLTEDRDADGHPVLSEYAFGGTIGHADKAFVSAKEPGLAGGGLTIKVHCRTDDAALAYHVSHATDLQQWTDSDVSFDGHSWTVDAPCRMASASAIDGTFWLLEIEIPVRSGASFAKMGAVFNP